MAFVVIYDACVLYPAPLRDLLVRVAQAGVVRARWTTEILDECFRSILKQRPELQPQALVRTRELMTQAVADCMVEGYEPLIAGLTLPDPDDREQRSRGCPAQNIDRPAVPPDDADPVHERARGCIAGRERRAFARCRREGLARSTATSTRSCGRSKKRFSAMSCACAPPMR